MAWKMTFNDTSPTGQRVEYWQCPGGGYSVGESPARVKVSGRVVVKGWSCDGKTFQAYVKAVQDGWTESTTV